MSYIYQLTENKKIKEEKGAGHTGSTTVVNHRVLPPVTIARRHCGTPTGTAAGASDAERRGEQVGGSVAAYFPPEYGRQRARAAARGRSSARRLYRGGESGARAWGGREANPGGDGGDGEAGEGSPATNLAGAADICDG
jgi:hypothetical protein